MHKDKPMDIRAFAHEQFDSARHFIFCTGIENSYPVIIDKEGKPLRRDGMRMSGHYEHYKEDYQLVKEMGINFLRTGPPYYQTHTGPLQYDWRWPDKAFAELRRQEIHPITDLCHFGVPDWVGGFQNPEWPPLFADYCAAFAQRYPWVRFYTPVNEIFIAARFSAQLGWWNERLKTDQAFVTALKHLARANILAEEAILKVRPDALFIQSESTEYFHPASPQAQPQAEFLNAKRFLSLDLCYGKDVTGLMYEYLADNGLSREEYHWFIEHGQRIRPHCIMGNDYYMTNEHEVLDHGGRFQPSGEIFGYYVITKQYYDRYHLPVMHTETNRKNDAEAPAWLWKEWNNVVRLKQDGVPVLGFTWYSLLDQTDWDTGLREDNHRINPLGLYDLKRKIRKVGRAYKGLIDQWRNQLPLESMCRDMFVHIGTAEPTGAQARGQSRQAQQMKGAARESQHAKAKSPHARHGRTQEAGPAKKSQKTKSARSTRKSSSAKGKGNPGPAKSPPRRRPGRSETRGGDG
jgi:beta-glucosidase/6-phospho-beta-glucosidase/beta-galactosidase